MGPRYLWIHITNFCLQSDEIKAADENARRAADDCQRLQDELRKAQTDASNMDKTAP